MDYHKLEQIAYKIPSMGGREIGLTIRGYAGAVKKGRSIVEVGSWLGAGTAQICLGLLKSGKKNRIYVYDHFEAHATEKKKAKKQGVSLKKRDTLPLVKKNLQPFNCDIKFIKGHSRKAEYAGEKIGLYIDDANKRRENFDHAMETFSGYFVPGETILILMDFFYYLKKPGDHGLKYQYDFMQLNSDIFEFVGSIPKLSTGIFLYKGGVIKYAKDEE